MTGYGQDDDCGKAMDAGFDRHMVKPVDPRTVVATTSNAFAQAEPER